ncbi:hypothetical protein CDL15_Pgr024969 [Punica granatum]|uniref:Uncharacterized protein n=1 Tax=Punica granatum TaxID=22663 RepID=A0A218W9N3_PUNGR|nr:hypothetical protein CDL15_Pgr024969 [Punica granatum]
METANSLSTEESDQLRRSTKRTKRVRIDRSRQERSNAGQVGITPDTTEGIEKGLANDKGKRKLSYSAVVAGDGEVNMDMESEEPTGEGNLGVKQAGVEMPAAEEIPMEMPEEIPEPSSEEEEADPGSEFCPNIRFSKEQLRRFRAPWWGSLIVKVLGQRVGYNLCQSGLSTLPVGSVATIRVCASQNSPNPTRQRSSPTLEGPIPHLGTSPLFLCCRSGPVRQLRPIHPSEAQSSIRPSPFHRSSAQSSSDRPDTVQTGPVKLAQHIFDFFLFTESPLNFPN